MPNTCPVCQKIFPTSKGRNIHLKHAALCRHWGKGNSHTVPNPVSVEESDDMEGEAAQSEEEEELLDQERSGDADEDEDEALEDIAQSWYEQDLDDLFFIDQEEIEVEIGAAGPGPSTQASRARQKTLRRTLEEEDDTRVRDTFDHAARVIRIQPSLHDRWKKLFSSEAEDVEATQDYSSVGDGVNPFAPSASGVNLFASFASEMDWRVARWAVQEGIGHGSFDRLLSIPGVRFIVLPDLKCSEYF